MESPLDKFITLAENYYVHKGTINQFIFKWVHPLLLKAKSEASKEDNPNCNQAMDGPFVYGYWQAACTKLEILEMMGDWDVIDCEDEINVIILTWYFKLK